MRRALALAAPHRTHPNPKVGAVLVDASGVVVGEGAHHGAGTPHAELLALTQAGEAARGSTLYVTLEPCNHQGRTPPCVPSIVAAGVSTVVIGAIDPDPRVSGAGIAGLRQSGVEVVTDVLSDESESLDRSYFHERRTGLPLVTLKLAMTLDGSVAASDASSRWVTSEEARADSHLLRAEMDAIVVGAGTLRADDPLLTSRIEPAAAEQPVAVLVAGREPLPAVRRIWERSPLVIATEPIDVPSGEVLIVEGEAGLPDPEATARALARRGLYSVMLEGGPGLAGSWWRAGVVTRGVFYVASRVGGGRGMSPLGGEFETMNRSRAVNIRDVRMVGPDIRIEFE